MQCINNASLILLIL